jgi:purine-binding chemotaxis protein CheW
VLISVDGQAVELIMVRVSEVLDIPKSEIEPPPAVRKGAGSRFIQGMGKVGEKVKIFCTRKAALREGAGRLARSSVLLKL